MRLAPRLEQVKPSPTLMVTVKVAALRREGIEVIDFGAGEPDFDTPDHIKDAAIAAMVTQPGFTPVCPYGTRPKASSSFLRPSP